MGALAPAVPWLPEDDLLLKNAVEAGASLESLAKGAVQFSRKYTVRELQDRWYSILYDPIISAEASCRMTELEHTTPYLPPKFSRTGSTKESKSLSEKRKTESVHSCYYALRKRVRNEPFNSMDLSFLIDPTGNSYIGNGDEHLTANGILEDSTANHLGFEKSQMDIIHHAFPQILTDGSSVAMDDGTAHGFHTGLHNSLEDNFPLQKDNTDEEIPHMMTDDLAFSGTGCGIEESGQDKELPAHGMFESDDLAGRPLSMSGQINSHQGHACLTFEENQVFNSPIPECAASFDNLGYSSLSDLQSWRMVESISAPDIPIGVSIREKDLHEGDNGDPKISSTSGCDVAHADSKLELQMPYQEQQSPTGSTDCYLAELSNSLFNEEEMFMNDDGKDMIDKSYYDGLSSLLLTSPNDINQDHVLNVAEPGTSVTLECLKNPSDSGCGELENHGTTDFADMDAVCNSEAQILVDMAYDPRFPEIRNGVICCVLNTEDTEIPCNDDIYLPNKSNSFASSSLARKSLKESGNSIPSSSKDLSGNRQRSEGYPVLMQKDKKYPRHSGSTSQIIGSQVMQERNQLHPVGEHDTKFKFPSSEIPLISSRSTGGNSTNVNSTNGCKSTCLPTMLKEENEEIALSKESFLEKPAFSAGAYRSYPPKDVCCIKQEPDVASTIQNHHGSNAEIASTDFAALELVENPLPSEPEELPIESDDDVPYYSDIEAMILDMDLDPHDQALYDRQVSRYQHEDTKRSIIRLEQGAYSYMQRAIVSHGAFAIFYGRHSKHYIKKPEVLLGRATEDVVVDIDLAREGRANKISRRQAIIYLDKGGSFRLKNLGKFSISVNNKEVAPGQSLDLISGCLIEIRGMPFIFEANQSCVKQYLDGMKNKPRSIKTECS